MQKMLHIIGISCDMSVSGNTLKFTNDRIKPTDRVGLFENSVEFSFKEHSKYTRKHKMLCAVPESRLT